MRRKFYFLVSVLLLLALLPTPDGIAQKKKHPSKKRTFSNKASYFGKNFHNKKTASGERYNQYDFTCAHRYYPFNTLLKVTNIKNNKSVIVRVNDRGPYAKSRVVDLSVAAAQCIDMIKQGVTSVRIIKLPPDSVFILPDPSKLSTDSIYTLSGIASNTIAGASLWKTISLPQIIAFADLIAHRLPSNDLYPPNDLCIRKQIKDDKLYYELLLNCDPMKRDRLLRELKKLGFFMAKVF